MQQTNEYKYEIAFSFLEKDELLAYQISDLIPNISTFIYSSHQKKIVGNDGQEFYTKTFHDDAKIVVILYRNGWGNTPWTRIEETAIKNRAFESGWEFLIVINLDKTHMPNWIPKTNIWADFERFGITATVGIIQYKLTELGYSLKPITIDDKINERNRIKVAEENRKIFLSSKTAADEALKEVNFIFSELKKIRERLTEFGADYKDNEFYALTKNMIRLQVTHAGHQNYIYPGYIRIDLIEMAQPWQLNFQPKIKHKVEYKFDVDLYGKRQWINSEKNTESYTSNDLLCKWVDYYFQVTK